MDTIQRQRGNRVRNLPIKFTTCLTSLQSLSTKKRSTSEINDPRIVLETLTQITYLVIISKFHREFTKHTHTHTHIFYAHVRTLCGLLNPPFVILYFRRNSLVHPDSSRKKSISPPCTKRIQNETEFIFKHA